MLALAAREPEQGDQVLEDVRGRVRVFVDDEVAEFVDDKLLYVELVEDRIRCLLEDQ